MPGKGQEVIDMGEILFDAPAKEFGEALPVGNGRLGAMIHGGWTKEKSN